MTVYMVQEWGIEHREVLGVYASERSAVETVRHDGWICRGAVQRAHRRWSGTAGSPTSGVADKAAGHGPSVGRGQVMAALPTGARKLSTCSWARRSAALVGLVNGPGYRRRTTRSPWRVRLRGGSVNRQPGQASMRDD